MWRKSRHCFGSSHIVIIICLIFIFSPREYRNPVNFKNFKKYCRGSLQKHYCVEIFRDLSDIGLSVRLSEQNTTRRFRVRKLYVDLYCLCKNVNMFVIDSNRLCRLTRSVTPKQVKSENFHK